MKILVLKANKQVYDLDFIEYANNYGNETGNTYKMGYLDDLIFDFTDQIRVTIDNVDVLEYDMVYFRTWEKRPDAAVPLAKHLLRNSKRFIDSAVGIATYGSKVLQHYTLMSSGIKLPKTFVMHKNLLNSHIQKYIDLLGGYPAILKSTKGKEGQGVYLLNSFEDFLKVESELKDSQYFIQEFIPNDFDYRFVVFGEEVAVVKKRVRNKNSDEFRNNVSLGAEVEYLDPKTLPELCELALKAAKAKNLQVAGVDIVINKNNNEPYIFEANPSPAFKNDFTVLQYLDKYFKSISL